MSVFDALPLIEPGPAVLLVSLERILIVDPRMEGQITELLLALESAEPLEEVIAVLTRDGVRRTPDFVLVIGGGSQATVLLRGRGGVVAHRSDGSSVRIDAESVSTWIEEPVFDAERFDVWLEREPVEARPWRTMIGVLPAVAVSGWRPTLGAGALLPSSDVAVGRLGSIDDVEPLPVHPTGEPVSVPVHVDSGVLPTGEASPEEDVPAVVVDPAAELGSVAEPIDIAVPTREPTPQALVPLVSEALEVPDPVVFHEPESSEVVDDRVDHFSGSATDGVPVSSNVAGDGEFDFGHLLDHTIYFGAEAAAVRQSLESEGAVGGEPPRAAAPPLPSLPVHSVDPNVTLLPIEDGPGPSASGLIDSVPGSRAPSNVSAPAPAPARPMSPSAVDVNATLTNDQLRALLGQVHEPPALPTDAPSVPAVRCPQGHLNPPEVDACRNCGTAIGLRSIVVVPRPSLGRLTFDTGKVVELTRPLLIGRKPPTAEEVNGELAQAVVIPDPDQMLSRLHLEIRLEGWQVLVVDRRSVNATYVTAPGKPQMQLRPGEPLPIVPETLVSLGDIVSFTYEIDRL